MDRFQVIRTQHLGGREESEKYREYGTVDGTQSRGDDCELTKAPSLASITSNCLHSSGLKTKIHRLLCFTPLFLFFLVKHRLGGEWYSLVEEVLMRVVMSLNPQDALAILPHSTFAGGWSSDASSGRSQSL